MFRFYSSTNLKKDRSTRKAMDSRKVNGCFKSLSSFINTLLLHMLNQDHSLNTSIEQKKLTNNVFTHTSLQCYTVTSFSSNIQPFWIRKLGQKLVCVYISKQYTIALFEIPWTIKPRKLSKFWLPHKKSFVFTQQSWVEHGAFNSSPVRLLIVTFIEQSKHTQT